MPNCLVMKNSIVGNRRPHVASARVSETAARPTALNMGWLLASGEILARA